uniref:DNA-directed DNA polymerase n=1 Tax=Tanacetum cinerariifolium TaxID=118510 RepID=A0A699HKI0_TANCI|nr:DNA-directed DNA polymerase [Tanacetum cinerariifolium]
MRTRSNFYPFNSTATIPRRSNRRRIPNIVEPEIRTIEESVPMADRTMEELLQAPTEGYGEAIVISKILAEILRLKRICFNQDSLNAASGGNLLNKTTREALKIIENKSNVHYSRSKSNVSIVNTNSRDIVSKTDDRIDKLVDQILNLVEIVNKQDIVPAKAVEKTCVTCGGVHAYYDCIATDSNQPSVCTATGSYNQVSPPNQASHQIPPPGFAPNQSSTLGTLPSNIVSNPKGEMKAVTICSGLAYEGPSIPTNSPLEKVDEQNTEEILDKEHSNSSGSTAQVQPLVVPILISEPDVPRTQPKPTIPYSSRLNDQKLQEKATNQMEKFFQIFHDLHFDISFADALLLMPKFASTIKSLLANKDKLFELAKVPLNENCSAMLLKKLPEKLGDPGKFLIPCDFPGIGRSFLRIGHALIDVYGEEITLRVNDESVTFNLNQTMRYSLNYDDNSVNRVDVIDITCEDFVQDVLDFQYNPKSSSPTLVSDSLISESDFSKEPIVKSSSPTLTPFGESDFFLEEIEDFLNDNSIPTRIENFVYDLEGDIIFLEKLLNEDPFQLPPMDLKLAEESKAKSFVEEPPELELKELPSHLEYAFLEDSNKLPVIIAKNLKDVERKALINVLKSHKRAIAWKISEIKGIDQRLCTHKILIEDDYKPAVQSQRRVNPKIHDVIKKEVIKLLDAGMIYHIPDSPRVSPIHCVPKEGGMTVVANENNELIPTRLVTGWRVCIDYRKLNDATRKDHFPLPFMDQMLERVAGNEFYCFLDGFSGYFQIPIDPQDQEKTTFTCPYGIFAYRRMPFSFCNAPGHKISKSGIEVDRAKVDVITKLPHPTTVKGVRSFLGHAGSENLAADHLSRLENAHKDMLENQNINDNFPLETLGSLSSHSTPWFADIANFHAGNFIKKGLTSQQKKKFFKDLLRSSKLAMRDLLGTSWCQSHSEEVDYLSKWVKAKALPTNDARVVVKFLKSLFSRFGIPRAIISNRGTHFCNDQFTRIMIKYGVTHRLATSYHPQTSGQVEVSNRGLKRILEMTVRENRTSWKLKTRWSGPFTIIQVYPYGTIELSQPNGLNFKVNGHRVKHYFGGDIPSNVAPNLHTFPMDNYIQGSSQAK